MLSETATKDVYMAAQGSNMNTVIPYTKDKRPGIVTDEREEIGEYNHR